MLYTSEFPICEFDTNPRAKICAGDYYEKTLPDQCVITFFRKELEILVREKNLKILDYLHSEILDIPIYEYPTEGEPLCITMPFLCAPGAAATLEELHAKGCKQFMVCGGAGCLLEGTTVGELILPNAAVRDEGTSYHYLPPAREVPCHAAALQAVKDELRRMNIPFREGKTWTTDAIYRETEDKIKKRLEEGCLTVEMEAAAFFAVSQVYGLPLAQLLYAGDDLSGDTWDTRDWNRQKSVRENLIHLTLKLVRCFQGTSSPHT